MNGDKPSPWPLTDRRVSPLAIGGCWTVVVSLLVLYATGTLSAGAFHALAEMACMAAGVATFLVAWNARRFVTHGFFLILGPAFLVAAAFDAAHIMAMVGLTRPPLTAVGPAAIWASGGLGLAASLCAGAWLPAGRRVQANTALLAVIGGNLGLLLAAAVLPDFGQWMALAAHPTGLGLLAAAGAGLLRAKTSLTPQVTRLVLGSLTCLALSEGAFAWSGPAPWPELLGHAAKIMGYCLGCQVAVVMGVIRPHELLQREMDRRERDLAARMARLDAQAQAITALAGLEAASDSYADFAASLLARGTSVLGLARAGVWRFNQGQDRLVCQMGSGLARDEAATELDVSQAAAYREALTCNRVFMAEDALHAPLTAPLTDAYLRPRGITAFLDAPVRFSGKLFGLLKLEHIGPPRRFTDDEQAFAGSLADMLVLARESAKRRQAAREKAESELRLRTLLDAMPDPVCFKDAAGRWVVANQAMLEAFGLADVDWRGRTDMELAKRASGDKQAFAATGATDARTWANREPSVFGLSLRTPADELHHYDVIKAPLYHADGRPKGLVVLGRDVTAYRNALARLRETNVELEAIYNETSDGLIITDVETRAIVRVNAAACRMFGYEHRTLSALPPWDLHPREEGDRARARFDDIAAGRLRLLENVPCCRAGGTLFFADIALQPITYGGRPAILGFYRDISERRRAEEALRASEDRFRRVFNSTYDAIFLHDETGGILDVNDKALELYGVRREDATAFSLEHDYSAPDNPAGRLPEYWGEVLSGQDRFFEWKARRPHDGSTFYVEVFLRRIALAERPVILANVRDVTERKRVLAALAARQEEISALNRDLADRVHEETEKNRQKDILLLHRTRLAAMGQMIGNIAHQWRQPLNALSILLSNMRFEYETTCDEENPALQGAHDQAGEILRKMSTTIDDFRNFFKPDKQRESFPVIAAIGDALLLIEATLAQHGVRLHLIARHDPRVLGFRGEFSQVMLNLMSNAKDAVLAARDSGGVVTVRVMQRRDRAVIHVTDNGGGIPDDVLGRIFDPYFTTKYGRGGTGLGLYIAKTIVEDHMQGRLIVTNVHDGARFTVRIPLAPVGPLTVDPESHP